MEGPFQLVLDHVLNRDLVVQIRSRHQPKSTTLAVRKVGRLSSLLQARTATERPNESDGPSLREALVKKLASLVPEDKTSTAGVGRRVRHTGTFTHDDVALSTARQRNKETVRQAQGHVSFMIWLENLNFTILWSRRLTPFMFTVIEIDPIAGASVCSSQDDQRIPTYREHIHA